ncbi:MAG: alginate export family protein [Deltaproteobacteria bacterium]|nr:alginate export family protein [Deltaproteobacteria bacterium]
MTSSASLRVAPALVVLLWGLAAPAAAQETAPETGAAPVAEQTASIQPIPRLRVEASESITVNLLYYHLRLDERPTAIASRTEPRLAAVRSKHLGDEIDLVVDWAVRDWLSVSAVTAVAFPGDAAKEFAGDDADWVSAMLLVVLHF